MVMFPWRKASTQEASPLPFVENMFIKSNWRGRLTAHTVLAAAPSLRNSEDRVGHAVKGSSPA